MQLEWNKWLSGLISFKEEQGVLWIFFLLVLVGFWHKVDRKLQKLLLFAVGMCVIVLCPLSAVVLLKGYTAFYDWFDLQLVCPLVLLLAWGGSELVCGLNKKEIPRVQINGTVKNIISLFCIAVLLLAGTTFHAFDTKPDAEEHGVPVEVAEILEPLRDMFEEEPLVLAAPSDILMYSRLYQRNWQPLYGQDLWSPKAASYINSGYDIEYQYYDFLEKERLSGEELKSLTALIVEGPADCVIVPAYWIADMGQLTGCVQVNLTDSYTGIIKKDLMTK